MNSDLEESLPDALKPLAEIAQNLRWVWHKPSRDLFERLDAELWAAEGNPVRLLRIVSPARLEQMAADSHFVAGVSEVAEDLHQYLDAPKWFQQEHADAGDLKVAYFSPEYGLSSVLPEYSGGLGVLAGDHLKTASDLGIPLVAVGLHYKQGYFSQRLSYGMQQELYPELAPAYMGFTLCDDVKVSVELGRDVLWAQVWRVQVGRVELYLLDTDIEENSFELRQITNRLYGGSHDHRLRQEILLGIGGVRALRVIGAKATVFHTNEGHAGFLGLERIRILMEHGATFEEALMAVKNSTVFTTHTPVPAGIDKFSRGEMQHYFPSWMNDCGVSLDELMALGHGPGESPDEPFNMAVMGLHLADHANGVSALHGKVSREMFGRLWPGVPVDDVPIGHVTNGVHPQTWTSPEMATFFTGAVGHDWPEASAERWQAVYDTSDLDLWLLRQQARRHLIDFVRNHMKSYCQLQGWTADLSWVDSMLDPDVMLVGFARRAATYKRLTLLLSQPDRLRRLLRGEGVRPVQFVFAGKSHPADGLGKELIQRVVQFSLQEDVRHRIAFLPDYDMRVAAAVVQGADVWLNTPMRPHEASGTSGEKAVFNGGLNCSVLDGWWDEMYDGRNGWAIGSRRNDETDEDTANSLYELLEGEMADEFYTRAPDGVPSQWIARMKHSLAGLGPQVSSVRMLKDYVGRLYLPANSQMP